MNCHRMTSPACTFLELLHVLPAAVRGTIGGGAGFWDVWGHQGLLSRLVRVSNFQLSGALPADLWGLPCSAPCRYIDGRAGLGLAPLHLAASQGNLAAVQVLVKAGASLAGARARLAASRRRLLELCNSSCGVPPIPTPLQHSHLCPHPPFPSPASPPPPHPPARSAVQYGSLAGRHRTVHPRLHAAAPGRRGGQGGGRARDPGRGGGARAAGAAATAYGGCQATGRLPW